MLSDTVSFCFEMLLASLNIFIVKHMHCIKKNPKTLKKPLNKDSAFQ